MRLDNGKDRDFLNFEDVADTIAEVIVGAAGRSQLECLVLGASVMKRATLACEDKVGSWENVGRSASERYTIRDVPR